jgi:hypothetical protein
LRRRGRGGRGKKIRDGTSHVEFGGQPRYISVCACCGVDTIASKREKKGMQGSEAEEAQPPPLLARSNAI